MVVFRFGKLFVLLRRAKRARSVAGERRKMAKVLENSKVLQDYRKSLHLRITLHKTLDQEARRTQVFSTGYTLGDSHKHTEHGYRVPQSGASTLFFSNLSRRFILPSFLRSTNISVLRFYGHYRNHDRVS